MWGYISKTPNRMIPKDKTNILVIQLLEKNSPLRTHNQVV